jgi:protoporphyrinogen oxidase
MKNNPVVIIGAGPAGLAAAYELTRQDIRPIVFEKSDQVGGIARTETYKGYHFDIGGHRFYTKIKTIDRLWREMLGKDFCKVSRLSRIYYQDRFFDYPLRVFNALSNMGILESVLITLSYFQAQFSPNREEKTFEQWVSNRFGRRLYNTFFKTYTEKVWGIPCHEIRADWAAQRIKGLSLIAAVTNALLKSQNAKTLIEEFDYPLRGPGMMWERFQEEIENAGGRVQLQSEVVGLKHEHGGITGVIFTDGEKKTEMEAGHVISSMPIPRLVTHFRSFIIVGLILNKRDLFPDQWIYVHSPHVRVGRIQNFKNWSIAMVPDPEKTSVGMEYFCDQGDELWNMSDDEFTQLASKELQALGLSEKGDVIDSYVIRQPKSYPVYDRDYARNLAVVQDYIGTIGNLQTVGRNGMHRYNNMDHSMVTGIMAARNMLGENHDLWGVTEDQGYLEEDNKTRDPLQDPKTILLRAFARMDKLAFASAVGTVSGLLVFVATIWPVIKGGKVVGPYLALLSQYFIGYTVTVQGAFIAFAYSFVWGFLFGWLFAYLRNFFLAAYIFWVKKKTELLSVKDFFDHL